MSSPGGKNAEVVRSLDRNSADDVASYNAFVDASPQGVLFNHTWWLDAVTDGDYDIMLVTAGDQIRASWVLWFDSELTQIRQPPLTQKLGILFGEPRGGSVKRQSEETRLAELMIDSLPDDWHLAQSFHENFTNWLPFFWKRFNQTTRYTYVLEDLSDTEKIWANMHGSLRTKIRKAKKEGIEIEETLDVERFYEVNSKSFERQGVQIPYSLEMVAKIDAAARAHGGCRITVAKDSLGRDHAGDFLVYDEQCAISLLGGADTELRSSGAKPLIQWESILHAADVTSRFDFEGSMMQKIEPYVRYFGGKQTPYFYIHGPRRAPKAASQAESHQQVGMLRHLSARVLRRAAKLFDPNII